MQVKKEREREREREKERKKKEITFLKSLPNFIS